MNDPDTKRPPNLYQRYRRLSLGVKILIFMVVGGVAGIIAGERAQVVQPVGDLFIRLLMMAVIPLIFFNLLAGLTSLTDLKALGRLGGKIIIFYLTTTVVALTVGLTVANVLKPGVGMQITEQVDPSFGETPRVMDVLLGLIPDNVFHAFASGNVSQVVVFAIFLGVATLMLPEDSRSALQRG